MITKLAAERVVREAIEETFERSWSVHEYEDAQPIIEGEVYLFGDDDDTVRVVLYERFNGDCERVRIALGTDSSIRSKLGALRAKIGEEVTTMLQNFSECVSSDSTEVAKTSERLLEEATAALEKARTREVALRKAMEACTVCKRATKPPDSYFPDRGCEFEGCCFIACWHCRKKLLCCQACGDYICEAHCEVVETCAGESDIACNRCRKIRKKFVVCIGHDGEKESRWIMHAESCRPEERACALTGTCCKQSCTDRAFESIIE